MTLDINTLFFLTMYVEAMLGILLLFAWVQNFSTRATAWWGAAHLLRSFSIALYGMYGTFPNLISIDLASALLFTSYGVTWTGTRVFDGRAPRPGLLAFGAIIWMTACLFPGFQEQGDLRQLLSGLIVAGFSWAAAYEFWRGRNEGLMSRWPAILLLFTQGSLFLLRTPLTAAAPFAALPELATAWLTVLSAEALLFMISIAFVLLAMGKERTELRHKTAAMIDPLTGLLNRRAFLQDAELVARNQTLRGRSIAVLAIDLDHFKSINDNFGHATGDRVLRMFGEVCLDKLRSSDLVGRLGGEEFALLLADASRENAMLIAERIRVAFENGARRLDGQELTATISIGVAIAQAAPQDLTTLLEQADQALYRAKARGRNRVELAPLPAPAGVADGHAAAPAQLRASA